MNSQEIDFTKWKGSAFAGLCRDILRGLGMARARDFGAKGIEQAFRMALVRESSDGMFRTDESWLCVFERARKPLEAKQMQPIVQAAIAADVGYLLTVIFGTVTPDAEAELREYLAVENIRVVLLTGSLAEALAVDYGSDKQLRSLSAPGGLSFAQLRKQAQTQVETAPWRKHFQTSSIQPSRLMPLNPEDEALAEADLFRALQGGSFLLLGEPGVGKTTSLIALGGELASAGVYMPVFLPLGRYQGDFWDILCESLAPNATPVQRATAQKLVESGALALLLDGINEVQDFDLLAQLVAELNDLTAPDEPTAHSLWIVSGRVHDYEQSRHHLPHLESRRWEMQPLTADLIFRFLADVLGEAQGLTLYNDLGEGVRALCANPLLLTMLLTTYQETGQAPVGRGALYRQFVELLLRWGDERGLGTSERETLGELLPESLTDERYQKLAQDALTALAAAMPTTMLPWRDAQQQFAATLTDAHNPGKAASLLLENLAHRGILRRDVFNRVSFFHHTFQVYFQARQLMSRAVDDLIPKDGVPAARREAVVFVAGLLLDPTPLIKQVLDVDLLLAFEMLRDAPQAVPPELAHQLAKKLWVRACGGPVTGESRSWALLFQRLASLLNKTVETLAAEIDSHLSQVKQTENLMYFYSELGDAQAQHRALEQAMTGEEVPEELLFRAARSAYDSGDYERAVELYTRYLEKYPNDAAAFSNRALAYKYSGRKDEALADYQRAVELDAKAVRHTNLAVLLHELDRQDEAFEHLRLALELDPTYAQAHSFLARWLESEAPETALTHREQSVRYAPHDDRLRIYLSRLANLQEKLGRYAEAIRSLRQMIALNPTSFSVKSWKGRIARLRQELDAEERKRSARERLQEQGELPLSTLAFEWMRAAGLTVKSQRSTWMLAEGERGLPVVLMPEPIVTGAGLRATLNLVPRGARRAKQIVVVTAAETLSLEARHQLAALQDEQTVALVTALEVRDALLQSNRECRMLLDRVLQRAGRQPNPFDYKGIVHEHTEFFGRVAELEELTALFSSGQQVGLYGIHKIGKSSLLEQLRRKLHLSNPEITVVKIELDASLKEDVDFFRKVLEKLPGSADLPQVLSPEVFRKALTDFHQRNAEKRPSHRLLLMLDEYPYLIPDRRGRGGLRGFIKVLGALKSLHQEGCLLLLPCGRTAALNRQARWGDDENPFIDLLHAHFLGPLPREENDALMTTLGLRAELTFTPEALDAVYAETGGHPAFSRSLGSLILRDGKGEVTEVRVGNAVDKLLIDRDQRSILLAIYEDRMDEDEQEIARTLALKGPQPRKSLFPTDADIPRRRQIRDALANLLDTTVLIQQDDENIAHRYGLLRRVIEQEMEELGL